MVHQDQRKSTTIQWQKKKQKEDISSILRLIIKLQSVK